LRQETIGYEKIDLHFFLFPKDRPSVESSHTRWGLGKDYTRQVLPGLKKSGAFSEIRRKSMGLVWSEIRNRRFFNSKFEIFKNSKKSRKICKKTRVNSKKSGEKRFSNLDCLINLNFVKFVQMGIKF
jgi:hypothetical protein